MKLSSGHERWAQGHHPGVLLPEPADRVDGTPRSSTSRFRASATICIGLADPMGHRRLHPGAGLAADAVGRDGRPVLEAGPPDVPDRADRLRGCVVVVQPRAEHRDADRGPPVAGHRRFDVNPVSMSIITQVFRGRWNATGADRYLGGVVGISMALGPIVGRRQSSTSTGERCSGSTCRSAPSRSC